MNPPALVDVHVHLAALPTAANGCYLSPEILSMPLARLVLWRLRIDPADPEGSNHRYLEMLVGQLRASRHVGRAVLLALDGVYDNDGRPDMRQTHFVISNDAVLAACREYPELLPAVSINPLRRDALDELDRCAEAGAVVVKWLPNTQGFDPADPRCRPFYRRLVRHRMPLLTHTGREFSLKEIAPEMGDPRRLRLPLDEGVTVIAAHAFSTGMFFPEMHLSVLPRMLRAYPNLYLDSSALCQPNRQAMALQLRQPVLQVRLLFGTDYPVPMYALPFAFPLGLAKAWRLGREANYFDKYAGIQRALGYHFAALPAGTRLAERLSEEAKVPLRAGA